MGREQGSGEGACLVGGLFALRVGCLGKGRVEVGSNDVSLLSWGRTVFG